MPQGVLEVDVKDWSLRAITFFLTMARAHGGEDGVGVQKRKLASLLWARAMYHLRPQVPFHVPRGTVSRPGIPAAGGPRTRWARYCVMAFAALTKDPVCTLIYVDDFAVASTLPHQNMPHSVLLKRCRQVER